MDSGCRNIYYYDSDFDRLYSILDIASVVIRLFAVKIMRMDFRGVFYYRLNICYNNGNRF